MDRVFGLLLLLVYVAGIVGLSAGVTFLVIRLFPVKTKPDRPFAMIVGFYEPLLPLANQGE